MSSDSEEETYEVEKIVDHRGDDDEREYFVKWMGYDDSNNTWEPLEHLEEASDLIDEYLASQPQESASGKKSIAKSKSDNEDEFEDEEDRDDEESAENEDEGEEPEFSTKHNIRSRSKTVLDDSDLEDDWGQRKAKRLRTTSSKVKYHVDANNNESDSTSDIENDTSNQKTRRTKKGDEEEPAWNRQSIEIDADGETKTLDVITDLNYPGPGHKWEKEIKEIVGVYLEPNTNDKRAILLWNNGDHSMQNVTKLHRACPRLLLEYYENHINFVGKGTVTEKSVKSEK